MSNINLFDSTLGIQNILNETNYDNLPQAKQIAASIIREAGMENIYEAKDFKKLVENLVCPSVGDGEILKPYNFSRALTSLADGLKNTSNYNVQDFLKNDLFPLLENEDLLRTYCGLMVSG